MLAQWLNSDECATYFGLRPVRRGNTDGLPNRRGFLERIASLPGFPKPLTIGGEKRWKLVELEEWADEQRRINRVA
jgi:hypothetical protein